MAYMNALDQRADREVSEHVIINHARYVIAVDAVNSGQVSVKSIV